MREMYKAMKYLYGRGLAKTTALVTDGRFSGTNNGALWAIFPPRPLKAVPLRWFTMATVSLSMLKSAL